MGRPRIERWYEVPGYEGRYQISTDGSVRSLDRIDDGGLHRGARQRRCHVGPRGRRYVILCKRGVSKLFCVSVLMAMAYRIPNPRHCAYVVHRNHDNRDFRRNNLAWATLAELRMHDGHKMSCPYYGVTRVKKRPGGTLRWVAVLRVNGRRHELGYFATPEEAAYAYDCEVKRLRLERTLNGLRRPKESVLKVRALSGEIWRSFPCEEGRCQISNKGRVRTVAHLTRNGKRVLPKLRRIFVNPSGGRSILIGQRRYGIPVAMARAFPTLARTSART